MPVVTLLPLHFFFRLFVATGPLKLHKTIAGCDYSREIRLKKTYVLEGNATNQQLFLSNFLLIFFIP